MKKIIIKLSVFTAIITCFFTVVSAELQSNHSYNLPSVGNMTVHAFWDRDGTYLWHSTTSPNVNVVPETQTANPNPRTLKLRARGTWMGNPGVIVYGAWGGYSRWVSPYGSTRSIPESDR